MFKRTATLSTLALAACGLAASPASAVVIDFESGVTGAGSTDGPVFTQGFQFVDARPTGATGNAADAQIEVIDTDPTAGTANDSRLRSRDFGGTITMTETSGATFDLASFSLSNFTFNAGHRHELDVTFNSAAGGSSTTTYVVGDQVPGNRLLEANFVVNQTGLSSVVFDNEPGSDATAAQPFGRLFMIDDLDVTVVPAGEVPEPASLAVLGLGGLALVRRRRA